MEQAVNTKAEKFRARAQKRVTIALRAIQRVGDLSRRSSYDYTPDEVGRMFNALDAGIEAANEKFVAPEKPTFRWDE